MIGKAVLIGFLAVVAYAYLTSQPLPADLAVEFSYTKFKALAKVFFTVIDIGLFFGADPVNLHRIAFDYAKPRMRFSDKDIQVFDEVFDDVPVRLYMPKTKGKEALKPGIVYMHGGGWILGSIDWVHGFVRQLALDTGTVIVNVGYRLAPEHVFPAAHDDSVKATVHFMKNAKKYGVDSRRIAVSGESVGGTLAATVSMDIRDKHPELKLKLQILNCPVTQCADFSLPSYQQIEKQIQFMVLKLTMIDCCLLYAVGDTYKPELKTTLLNNRLVKSLLTNNKYSSYLNHSLIPRYLIPTWYRSPTVSKGKGNTGLEEKFADQVINPYLSPLLSPNLKSLPEAYVMVSEFDVLRDDALLYIRRLREANVTVTEAFHKTFHNGAVLVSPAQERLQLGGEAEAAYYKMLEFIKNKL